MKEIELIYKTSNTSMGKILATAIVLCIVLMAVPIAFRQDVPIGFVLVLAMVAGILVVLYSSTYKLSLGADTIKYSYLIWHGIIQISDITSMKLGSVSPIRAYGGFGYRAFGKSKRAIILQGNLILEVVKKDEQIFHFGIDKGDQATVEAYLSSKNIHG